MGSIVKRGDVYRAMVRMKGFPSASKSFDTRKEAKLWIEDTEREMREREIDHPDVIIDALIDRYIKEIAPKRGRAPTHLTHDIPNLRNRVGALRLSELTGRGLTSWVLKNTDISAGSRDWHVSKLYGVLRQVELHFGIAIPWKDMDACRRKLREMAYIAPGNSRDRRVSDDEMNRIKRAIGRTVTVQMGDVLDFCLQSCMRIGEVCRLEWGDLDVKAQTIVVRDRKHPTKKYGNHCVVPLLNGAFETLMRQPRRSRLVFPHGKEHISRRFQKAARVAGIEDIRLHDLRHEGISRLFELGFSIEEVALVSGHTNWRTLRRYTHLRPESLVARERVLRALAKKTAQADSDAPVGVKAGSAEWAGA